MRQLLQSSANVHWVRLGKKLHIFIYILQTVHVNKFLFDCYRTIWSNPKTDFLETRPNCRDGMIYVRSDETNFCLQRLGQVHVPDTPEYITVTMETPPNRNTTVILQRTRYFPKVNQPVSKLGFNLFFIRLILVMC